MTTLLDGGKEYLHITEYGMCQEVNKNAVGDKRMLVLEELNERAVMLGKSCSQK